MKRLSDDTIEFRVIDTHGDSHEVPIPAHPHRVNGADHKYFRVQQNPRTRGLFISDPILGRITGKWVVPVSYPIRRTGSPISAIVASIRLDSLVLPFEAQREKPDGSITVLKSNGVTLIRAPSIEGSFGKSLAQTPDYIEHLNINERGLYRLVSPYDRVERMVGHARLSGYPIIVAVTASVDDVLAPWRDHLHRMIALMSLITIATILIAYRFLRDESVTHMRLVNSEETFRNLFNNTEIGMLRSRLDGSETLNANEKFFEIVGRTREEVIGKPSVVYWVDPKQREEMVRRLKSDGRVVNLEFQMLNKQGGVRDCITSVKLYPEDGILDGSILDITERKQAESALRESERRFHDMLSSVQQLAVMLDLQGNITFCNDYILELTGWQRAEVLGRNWFEYFLPETVFERVGAMFATSIQTGNIAPHYENEIVTRQGIRRLIVWDNTILRDEQGRITGTASLGIDISERKQAEELIWRQANFDALTDLPNRRMFHDRLEQEIKKANRAGNQLALLFIDLDNFKEVNDTLGHPMGDLLLVEASRRIGDCVRETDTVARLGGDEFTVLLTELDQAGSVERVALSILGKLAESFRLANEVVVISASIGITLYPNDAEDIDELLKSADQAMYAAKKLGRNRYSYFTPSLQEEAQNRLRLINDLRAAVAGEQFLVYFQPIVELSSDHIHKAEALVRWQHPQRGLVSPAEFIPLAEETGLIVEIGNWVFKESARWALRWRSQHFESFQVSVNKSPVQFHKDNINDGWLAHMLDIGLSGHGIVVEITEGLLLESDDPIMESLLTYRDSGIQVAIDDFGTGYSSLSYLNKFDIDYLKIDQSFVRKLAPGSSDMALSEAIIVMAHKLGLKVIAEGVETAEQRDLLAAAGCDFAQGYLFSRPIPPEEFEKLLEI